MEAILWAIRTVALVLYIPIGIAIELFKLVFWGAFKLVFSLMFAVAAVWLIVHLQPVFLDVAKSIDWFALNDQIQAAWRSFLGVTVPSY